MNHINEQLNRESSLIESEVNAMELEPSATEYNKYFSTEDTELFKMFNVEVPGVQDDLWHFRKIGQSKKTVSLQELEAEQKKQDILDREARVEALADHYAEQMENGTEESYFKEVVNEDAETFELGELLSEFTRKNFWGNL